MSRAQAEAVEELLRNGPLDLGGDLLLQRPLLDQLMTSHPLPDGIVAKDCRLGGVPGIEITDSSVPAATGVLLYFHGGGYALGSARGGAGLLAELVERTSVTGISIGYRLAPEHPYPAALRDAIASYRGLLEKGVPASDIVVVGESAGGGLSLALLLASKEEGLPQPRACVVFSPWADLTLTSDSLEVKADVDPALNKSALQVRAADYAGDDDLTDPRISPVFGDYQGLPDLLVQVGSHEVLLDDALRVSAAAARADVAVRLEVTPHVPHVFQGFAAALDQGRTALDSAAAFIRHHLHDPRK